MESFVSRRTALIYTHLYFGYCIGNGSVHEMYWNSAYPSLYHIALYDVHGLLVEDRTRSPRRREEGEHSDLVNRTISAILEALPMTQVSIQPSRVAIERR